MIPLLINTFFFLHLKRKDLFKSSHIILKTLMRLKSLNVISVGGLSFEWHPALSSHAPIPRIPFITYLILLTCSQIGNEACSIHQHLDVLWTILQYFHKTFTR